MQSKPKPTRRPFVYCYFGRAFPDGHPDYTVALPDHGLVFSIPPSGKVIYAQKRIAKEA